jgi:hypothetical protein
MSEERETETAEESEEFLNRAARRAKGKKRGHADPSGPTAGQPHGRAVVESRRQQFGNRRTG